MKRYLNILPLIIICAFNTYSQQVKDNKEKLPVDYGKKSRKQLKTGIVLSGAGAVMFLGGTYLSKHGCACKDPTGSLFMLGGIGMAATSIPFFISSAGNKHKAKLYMKKEALMLTPDLKTGIVYNSIGLKIGF